MANVSAITADVSQALSIVETVANLLAASGLPIVGAISTGVKVAQGVIAEIPQAQALWDQFESGTIPSQANLDAYAAAEDSAYAKLMADIAAKQS
jgi:hypothetical protein